MRIINVGQLINLEQHTGMLNQFTVRLENGREVIVWTDESTVAQLIDAAAKEVGPSSPYQPPPQEEPLPPEATEFGGDLPDPGEDLSAPAPPAMGVVDGEEPLPEYRQDKLGKDEIRQPGRNPSARSPGGGHPNKKGRIPAHRTVEIVPARTVPMDEMGNPIVPKEHRVENRSTMSHLGPGVDDEDGTSI